jgi:hypothetical protein
MGAPDRTAFSVVLCDLEEIGADASSQLRDFRQQPAHSSLTIVGVLNEGLRTLVHAATGGMYWQVFDFFVEAPIDLRIIFDLLRARDPVLQTELSADLGIQ